MNIPSIMQRRKTLRYVKGSDFELYIKITLRHVDTIDLAAIYAESFINGYRDDYASIIADEIVARADGFDMLIKVCASLYQQGIVEAIVPIELKVIENLINRGDAYASLQTLINNNNLKNAVKIIAAGCDWLPADEINDDLLDKIVVHLSSIAR